MYKHEDSEYANSRLAGTWLLRKDGVARYVLRVFGSDGSLVVRNVDINHNDEYDEAIENFQLKPPKLGLVLWDGVMYDVFRSPKRRDWRHGLRENNVCAKRLTDTRICAARTELIKTAMEYPYPDLNDTRAVLRELTKLDECSEVPLSQSLYAKNGTAKTVKHLYHKLRGKVGVIKKGEVVLLDKHEHLRWGFK